MGDVPTDWPENVPFHKWPPFPTKPEGVTIIPFSQFKATGLKVDQDDDDTPAVDQQGIRTTGLQARHDGEKKKRRRKKKNEKGEIVEVPLAWWEELEEDTKNTKPVYKYDHRETYLDRMIQSWKDFNEKRHFPTHVQAVAHALGICLGMVDPNPNGVKTNPKAGSDDDGGGGSDDEFPDEDDENADAPADSTRAPVTQDLYDADLKPESSREKAADAFFQDPERITKLFLTSYAYDKGIYWNQDKLRDTPILVGAFLNFLEVNQVFRPEEKSTRHGIAQGKKVAQLAKEEMPHANKLATVLPGSLGTACGALWGQRLTGPSNWVFGLLPDEPAPAAEEATPTGTPPAEPTVTGDAMLFEPTDTELLIDAIEPPSINGVQTEWTNTGGDLPTSNGWGSSNAWGPGAGEGGGWGGGAENTNEDENADEGENAGENPKWDAEAFMEPPPPDPETVWGKPGPSGHEQLEALIGPNNLAKTYVTLRVEIGSRVIGNLVEPPTNPTATTADGTSFADIAQQRLARLTLSPSRFLNTAPAYGACITKPDMIGTPIDESKFGWVGPHDPSTNDITVFVPTDEELLDVIRKGTGMTITGTFVQVVELAPPKEDESAETEPTGEPAKKKKKKKGKKDAAASVRSWWFLYQLTQVLPTFYEQ